MCACYRDGCLFGAIKAVRYCDLFCFIKIIFIVTVEIIIRSSKTKKRIANIKMGRVDTHISFYNNIFADFSFFFFFMPRYRFFDYSRTCYYIRIIIPFVYVRMLEYNYFNISSRIIITYFKRTRFAGEYIMRTRLQNKIKNLSTVQRTACRYYRYIFSRFFFSVRINRFQRF